MSKGPTTEEEVEAARYLAMLDNVKAGDPGAQQALDELRKYLKEIVGLNDYQ